MRSEVVQIFSDREEEMIDLMVRLGMQKIVAKFLVCLVRRGEASAQEIGREADLRQAEVSTAGQFLIGKKWVRMSTAPSAQQRRRHNIYTLAVTPDELVDRIGKGTERETQRQLAVIENIRRHN